MGIAQRIYSGICTLSDKNDPNKTITSVTIKHKTATIKKQVPIYSDMLPPL